MEASTRYVCKQCGGEFAPTSRRGEPQEFCRATCRYRWHNGQRLKGAALLKDKARGDGRRASAVSRHTETVSRAIFQGLVPVEQRADLIRQACINRGIIDSATIDAALKPNGCPAESSAFSLQPSVSLEASA